MDNIGAVLTGNNTGNPDIEELNAQASSRGFWGEITDTYHNAYLRGDHFGQNGFAPIFQDPNPSFDGGNQLHHYWFYVQVGLHKGFLSGAAGNFIHETVLASTAWHK